jgi:hypothetical protein
VLTRTLLILYATHCLGGVAAFGSTLLALPLLLITGWELRPAVAVLVILGTTQALQMVVLTWRGACMRTLARIVLWAGAGIPIGFLAAGLLPQRTLGLVLGLLLFAAGASRLAAHLGGTRWQPPPWILRTLLVAGGVIHGAFGSGGTTLTVYGRYAIREKSAFRGTLSIMWVVLNSVVITGLLLEGEIGSQVLATSAMGIPLVFLATWTGHRLSARLSQERFADVVAALLCLAGILTVGRNLVPA